MVQMHSILSIRRPIQMTMTLVLKIVNKKWFGDSMYRRVAWLKERGPELMMMLEV